MSDFGLKPVFGSASIWTGAAFGDPEDLKNVYKRLEDGGCKNIDTARLYNDSETLLGKSKAGERFIIDSKTPGGFIPGGSNSKTIPQHVRETIENTGAKQLDIYYIHAPDPSLPLEDMLEGVQEAYKEGHFRRFGLSNYKPSDVERAHAICKEKGWVLPTVYQGNYNAVARLQETQLFPTLRKLGISFYAYSPIAGGFLTKTAAQLTSEGADAGRFAKTNYLSKMYNALYNKPSYLKALELWGEAAEAAGCSRAELAYRWIAFDSPLDSAHGDGIVFGASKLEQITQTLSWLKKGSVGAAAKAKIDEIWETIKNDAPVDNYHDATLF